MKYLVVTRYLRTFGKQAGEAWKTIQKEFNDKECAEAYAREMYECQTSEICVMIYEQIECFN